jgi:hypothetical protein
MLTTLLLTTWLTGSQYAGTVQHVKDVRQVRFEPGPKFGMSTLP